MNQRQIQMAGRRLGAVIGILILIMGLGGCGNGAGEQELESFVVALKPDKNPDAMLEDRDQLQDWLEARLERPVEVIVPASGPVIEQGMANGTIDVAFVSATTLARYAEAGHAGLLLAVEIDGQTTYRSYWVALSDKPYDSVTELEGRPVCFASPTSTSGYLIPAHDLFRRGLVSPEEGLEGFFGRGNVLYGTGYVSAIQRVFAGQAEAAAVSDYVIEGDKHLGPAEKERLRIVQAQGPVPTHCLAVRTTLGEEDRKILEAAFLAMNDDNPDLRDRLFTATLVKVDPEGHLKPIREALDFMKTLKGR